MGKCCVSGAGDIIVDYKAKTLEMKGKVYKEGDWISLNGSTGEVYDGPVPTADPELDGDFAAIMNLADKYTKCLVRTNADTPRDARQARHFGAQGIGLCRTEHMFFEGDRIKAKAKVDSLEEFNPMLGHRGCRLGITYPEITEMQSRAIIEAALNCKNRGIKVYPEIMIPLVGTLKEIQHQANVINETAIKVFEERGETVAYKVGTMIEIPRAAHQARTQSRHLRRTRRRTLKREVLRQPRHELRKLLTLPCAHRSRSSSPGSR